MADERPCPACGKPTRWYPECPRYGGKDDGTGWLCCFPACGNADGYECTDEHCEWPGYIGGLNKRYEAQAMSMNASRRPDWLKASA